MACRNRRNIIYNIFMVFDESEMSILPLALVIPSRMFRRRIATNQKDHSSYDTDNSSKSSNGSSSSSSNNHSEKIQ
ncbi:MAG TPA: hypothetical protein VE264_06580 [Nitrososphaera sp.]|nr:hypothetical protein [Nitrososphaera sp.]